MMSAGAFPANRADHRCKLLFWAAFILTRPLGVTVGDVLDELAAGVRWADSRQSQSA